MSNTQSLTTEQRIAIVAEYNAEKIKEIKELMEEAVSNAVLVPENDWVGQYAEYFTIQSKTK